MVLVNGHRDDVADAAPIEVTGRGVVNRVVVPPADEGCVEHKPQDRAEPGVAAPRSEEGPVSAVVEDDVGAQEKAGGRNPDREDEQV